MSENSTVKVVRGGIWLYLRSLVNNVVGFFYWFAISAIAGPEVVGLTSAVMSLAFTITGLITLGTGIGVQRFIGFCRGRHDNECSARYFWSTALFRVVVYSFVGLFMILLGLKGISIYSITSKMLLYAGIMVALNSSLVLDPLLIAYLTTKPLFLGSLLGQAIRFPVGVGLVLAGWGWVGAFIGILIPAPLALLIKLKYALKIIKPKLKIHVDALRDVLRAGIASWLPGVITLLGQQLGILLLFGARGAVETGQYYVAYAMVSVVQGIGMSILQLMLPVLSGMPDGRKRASARAIKLSLTIVSPLVFVLAVYSYVPLGLLGKSFVTASPILMLLSLSVPASFIALGVNNLIYAYGFYNLVLILGLSMNMTRIITYAPFSSLWGGLGTALSYLLGSCMALITSIFISHRIGFNPGYKEAVLAVLPPLMLAIPLYYIHVYWLIGVPLMLIIPYIVYLKLHILTKRDLRDLASAIVSERTVDRIYKYLQSFIDWLTE